MLWNTVENQIWNVGPLFLLNGAYVKWMNWVDNVEHLETFFATSN